MHNQLKMLAEIIESIDSGPQAMQFYTDACDGMTVVNKPVYNIKWLLVRDTLHRIEHTIQNNNDCMQVDHCVERNLVLLNERYRQNQHLCWLSHQHHFHVSLEQYVNCPVTCLYEITEFLNKLIKEIYHQ